MRERFSRPIGFGTGDSVRELRGPDEVMTTHFLASGLGEVEEVVAAGEVEDASFGLGVHELLKNQCCGPNGVSLEAGGCYLQDISRRSLAKVMRVIEFFHVVLVTKLIEVVGLWDVRCGAEVYLSDLLRGIVESKVLRGGSGKQCRGWISLSWSGSFLFMWESKGRSCQEGDGEQRTDRHGEGMGR